MDKNQAIKLLEELVQSVMAQGGIKDFATLDKLREAIWILKQPDKKEN